jgi:two-component system KDP operon response regulator KdpE
MTTILVVEDEPEIRRFLRSSLGAEGYKVVESENARRGAIDAGSHKPDLAIVDLALPDYDGKELIRQIRAWSPMPIVVLSARNQERSKIDALDAGADDYITKPFGPRELVARLQANLRRTAPGPEEAQLQVDGLEVDLARRTVQVDGNEVHLTPTEFDLLRQLVRNRGRLMTHRDLLLSVWGPGYGDDTQVLRAHIANLRRKIEPPEGRRYIRTDPGVGYRFAA